MMRSRATFLLLFLVALTTVFLNCRTTQSRSDVRNIDSSATDGKCLPPLIWYEQNPVKRLTTPELEKHLNERINANEWECDINSSLSAAILGLKVPDGQEAKDYLASKGGLFGSEVKIQTPQGEVAININDNSMRYNWSLDGAKGGFLPPEKWYNHIIPQRRGADQPELRRFLRNGDIIVYFDHKNRSTDLDAYNQFRSGHSSTILEITDSDNKTQFMLVDTPSSYARPISGHDPTLFHVFRIVPRDGSGASYTEEEANGYRDQIAKWGSLALGQFPFEGDYDKLAFKSADQIDDFAKRYLASQFTEFSGSGLDIYPMYCAWYSFQNMNLGFMRPMNQSGLALLTYDPAGVPPVSFYDRLMQGPNGFEFPNLHASLVLDSSSFNDQFKAPDNLKPHSDMLFQPVTAPELVMNFLDRTIGPDVWVPENMWVQHASLKVGILEQGKQSFLDKFNSVPNPNMPVNHRPSAAEYDSYNQALDLMFKNIVTLYKESLSLQGDALNLKRKEITEKTFQLVTNERSKPVIPKKWVPPYAFTREADAFESFYRPETNNRPYRPRMVYVGTVIPEIYLKEPGAEEPVVIVANPETIGTLHDYTISSEVGQIIQSSGAAHPYYKSTVEAFMMELHKQCIGKDPRTCDGLNEFELAAILALRGHWRPDIQNVDPDVMNQQIAAHNMYGLDDVLIMRTLVSYWNDPTDFRAAIYEGDASTLASIALNLRIIMSVAPTAVKNEADRIKPSGLTTGHPRRVSPIKCRSDEGTLISQTNQKCAVLSSFYY